MSTSSPASPRLLKFIPMLALTAAVAGCGTTSSMQVSDAAQVIDLTPYTRLLVEDFADEATSKAKPELRPLLEPTVSQAVKLFPDQIAAVTRDAGAFEEVLREGPSDATTLILRGAITQFDEGNATLRWIVGFNAGNANFDARLELIDGATSRQLGTWIVDKNSWALGGGIAATQRPEDFMAEAAAKIGTELSTRRKAGSLKKPG
jgi:hypothetical protein